MSTAKLLINKYKDGSNFRSLYVTFPNEDNCAGADIRFSEWIEGINQHKKNETEKSSRLIVKIVSGEDINLIDLDTCAREINKDLSRSCKTIDPAVHIDQTPTNVNYLPQRTVFATGSSDEVKFTPDNQNAQNYDYNIDLTNPLEQSLQKVKANNARIMENIHFLNRTLNYTKKKEILDIIYPKSLRTFPCNACGKCFVYETGLRRHYAMRHEIPEDQPRWQTVWTCIQCFQVWPRQEQALLHSAECYKVLPDSQEYIREIKTSLLLQCEFCEKVFTSIPRLLRHSKIHTTDNNYECIPCGLGFMSYKIAEQHWPLCSWLKMFYSFSLPKMLLCNACDRKFRNYEQLYSHRYKMGHFMTKVHSITAKSLGVLVYQCELCSQWYNSIPQMISHRSQHHPYDTGISNTDSMANENTNYYLPALVDNQYYLNKLS